MSLLMDALRKAEEAKRKARSTREEGQNTDEKSTAGSELTLDAVPEPKRDDNLDHSLGATAPDQPEELELPAEPPAGPTRTHEQGGATSTPVAFLAAEALQGSMGDGVGAVEQELDSGANRASSAADGAAELTSRRAAQSIFDANVLPLRSARMWFLFGGVPLMLVVLATGAYFLWLDLTSGSGLVSTPTIPSRVAPAVVAQSKAPALPVSPALVANTAPSDVAAIVPTAPRPQVAEPEGRFRNQHAATEVSTPVVEAGALTQRLPTVKHKAAAPATPAAMGSGVEDFISAGEIKIARRTKPASLSPDLKQAFAAYSSGNHASARIAYRRVLQRDGNNVHALLGLAAIAMQNGLRNSAAELYAKVIRLDPNNSVARAALLTMRRNLDAVAGESQIKRLLVREPDAAHLHFILGNLYAAQSRWAQAQRAYFNAYRVNPDNADFVYNLAVSLDQLAQANAALEYYRRALTLADGKSVGFDPSSVLERVRVLSGSGRNG